MNEKFEGEESTVGTIDIRFTEKKQGCGKIKQETWAIGRKPKVLVCGEEGILCPECLGDKLK